MSNAFSRAIAMMSAIAAAMRVSDTALRQIQLDAIGPYESRGKGRGKTSPSRHRVAMDRRGVKKPHTPTLSRSKYAPHFGAKQQAKLAAR